MKLVISLYDFVHGKSYGFEEYICNLLDYFSKNRKLFIADDVIVACAESQLFFFQDKYGKSFTYHTKRCEGYFQKFYLERSLYKDLRLAEEDIVLYPGNYMPLGGGKHKKVLVVHDLLYRHGELLPKKLHMLFFRLQKYLYVPISLKRANKVVAISKFTRSEIIKYYGIPKEKINVIYNYFNFDKYLLKGNRTIPDVDSDFFLSICARYPHKDHLTIIRAFQEYCISNKEDKLVFVGRLNTESESYLSLVSADVKKRILILSHISTQDIYYLYTHAKAYISASLYEGFGMPIAEALYFGLPTLLSDTIVHREVSMGLADYFPCKDYKTLSSLMGDISNHNYVQTKVEHLFSAENTSAKYLQLINDLSI